MTMLFTVCYCHVDVRCCWCCSGQTCWYCRPLTVTRCGRWRRWRGGCCCCCCDVTVTSRAPATAVWPPPSSSSSAAVAACRHRHTTTRRRSLRSQSINQSINQSLTITATTLLQLLATITTRNLLRTVNCNKTTPASLQARHVTDDKNNVILVCQR